MQLEDHAGDIVRKARAMSNVSKGDAAKAAGLSEAELDAFEESGKAGGTRPNFQALSALLGLNGAKLEAVANGWLPSVKDLNTWRELRCITTTSDGMAVNCYLIW